MRNKVDFGLGRRTMKNLFKVQIGRIPVITLCIVAVAVLPTLVQSFGTNNRRPIPGPPPQQSDRQLVNGPGPNNRPPGPPPPQHIQSIKRQGVPFDDEPPRRRENNNDDSPNHRRNQNRPHGPPPPPHHSKPRGRPPFPFPRRRPPPPPPRGRGPPPPRGRERERERDRDSDRDGPRNRRPQTPPNAPPEQPPKLSFHIPPAPPTTPQPPHHHQDGFQQRPPHMQQDGFQNRPPMNGPQTSESQFLGSQQFNQQNIPHQPQFHQQLQHQLQQQQQQQNPQFNTLNNGNGFPNQLQQFQNQNNPQQQPFPQNGFGNQPPQGPPPGFHSPPGAEPTPFQQFPSVPPNGFMQQNPSAGPPNGFIQGQPGNPLGGFPQQGSSVIPPTPFQGPGIPIGLDNGFQQTGHPQQHPGFPFENPQQPMPSPAHPSQMVPFNNNPEQQQHFQQQPVFGQINPPPPSHPPHPILQHIQNQNNPNNPPILEYAPPPNTFQSTPQPDQLPDKSKEIELNSIPKQTITFTVTPKPSKSGGTQLHFKISTPKPFKTTLKPLTNSKGYFKGSTYRPPVDKLNSKFKYNSNSNAGYPDAEYKPQDGRHRESSMSAEMEPPIDQPRNNIKDLLMNREHNANQPSGPHPDDTDNYAGSSYEAPPVFVKPSSGEHVLIAGVTGGKSGYHKGHHNDEFRGPGFEEDYDSPLGAPHHTRHPFGDDEEGGSKYSDRHLDSYLPIKQNSFEEGPSDKPHGDPFRRPPFSGSHEGPFDEFAHGGKNRPRPHLIGEEGLVGSGEKPGRPKFSQPDPLYHPEGDGGSGSKERDPSIGEEFDGFGFGGSGERRNKADKESKNTAEELLAALGLSTNPLVSMPNGKYPVDIASKFSLPSGGSWEKDYQPDSEKRNKVKEVAGEPMGLLEYLSQKEKEEGGGQQSQHSTEPLYSVPDRPIGSSDESSFVVKGSMKTGAGSGENLGNRPQHNSGKGTVVMGRPIPQYQGSEHENSKHNPVAQQSSYIEQKVKGHASSINPGQDSYLYDKIHGVNHKTHGQDETQIGVINSGLYGPSVPPPIGEVGAFTNSPPVVTSAAPVAHIQPTAPTVLAPQQPIVGHAHLPGAESYLYQKIHGDKPNLAFGPTPTSPHSLEDQSGLYNSAGSHIQSGLYSSPSEQVSQVAPQQNANGLVYNQGKLPQQQLQQTSLSSGVLLPLGMGGNQQASGLAAANTIPVNAPHQKPILINHQQQLFQQQLLQQQQQQQQLLQQQQQLLQQQQQQLLQQQQSPPAPQQPLQLSPQQIAQQHQAIAQQQQFSQQIQQKIPQAVPQTPGLPQQPQLQQGLYQNPVGQLPQQPLQVQQSQQVPQVLPAPSQQHGALYGSNPQVDRIAKVPNYSGEVGLQQSPTQQQSYLQQPQSPNPYAQQNSLYQGQVQYSPGAQQQLQSDSSVAASHLQHLPHPHNHFAGAPGVTPSYGNPYPVYVTEPDPIIEIIVQDSNMTLPAMPTLPPPPPPPPPTPEPVHVFYVKYSQNNNTPTYDYYGQASNPQIQLEQPISSVPVRGPDRNGMLPVEDFHDAVPQASVQHQSIYNSVYSTTTETPLVGTTPPPSGTTTLRTIIRPDRNEFAHGGSGLVVSFDNPAVEQEIFANYTNLMQQQMQQQQQLQLQQEQQQLQQQQQQQQQQQLQQQQDQLQQQQNAAQYNQQQQPQQQGHAYPDMSYQQTQGQQQQMYPSLDSLWGGLTAEQKTVMVQQQAQMQQQQEAQQSYSGFNKRIGLQELASLLETGPQGNDGQQQQKHQEHVNENINLQDYHSMHQNSYSMNNNEQTPAPLYQYVESQHHQTPRQAKLPDDVPEELKNQLVKSGILGNADVQVINYSENLFKELSDLQPEALAAFQAHTGNQGQHKQLDSNSPASSNDQSVWSGSQVSLSNTDLSSLMPSGRSLRSVLVVKNSLRPKRGGRQRRVVLLITNKDDVLLYKPKDRSLKRIGDTNSKPVIKGAIELSNHRMDDEESLDRGTA